MESVTRLRNSSFLRHNAVFFFGSLLVGILNYAFYPIVGRLLTVSDYGEVQALISLFTQLAVFLGVLSLVNINIVANYKDEDKKRRVTLELEKLGLLISLVILLIGVLFSSKLESFFHFSSVWPFRIMLLAFVVTVPFAFRTSYLRAHKKFGLQSISSIIGATAEIIIAVCLISLGFGAMGALSALVLSQLIAYSYAAYMARKIGFKRPEGSHYLDLPEWDSIAPEAKYSLFVLFLSLTITIFSSADIFVVKHYFSPQVAGLYAGVSIIGRSIFFITAPIAAVLLPLVKMDKRNAINRNLLIKSLGLLVLIGGSALIIFSLFPNTVISILMGHKYLVYAHLLPLISLAMFIFSLLNMLIVYSIALREYHVSSMVAVGLGLAVVLTIVRHDTIEKVVTNLIYCGATTLLLFSIWHFTNIFRKEGRYA